MAQSPQQLFQFGIDVCPSKNALVIPEGLRTMGTLATHLKVGDRRPVFQAQLFDPVGAPMDLTALTVVFRMRKKLDRRTNVIDDVAMTITDALLGLVEYAWAGIDTATEGEFDAWVIVDHGAGVMESYPNSGSHTVRVEQ